jgi:hypothetical protein
MFQSNPRLCGDLYNRSQKMVLETPLPEFNQESILFSCEGMIAHSMENEHRRSLAKPETYR